MTIRQEEQRDYEEVYQLVKKPLKLRKKVMAQNRTW